MAIQNADLAVENEELRTSLAEARQREAAIREVLTVLNRSRSDEKAVFDVILDNALRLCDAHLGMLILNEEGDTHQKLVAQRGGRSKWVEMFETDPTPLDPAQSMAAKAALEKAVVQVEDLADTDLYRQGQRQRVMAVETEGIRTFLAVPLIGERIHAGAICIYLREVKPFSDGDIDLIRTFAEQAVNAIENARQAREVQTRLQREAASREILGVISQSRDDEGPVFDVILENATRLCKAQLAFAVMANDGRSHLHLAAHKGDSFPEFVDYLRQTPMPLDANEAETSRSVLECRTIHIEDLRGGELYDRGQPHRMLAVKDGGIRTLLIVPLVSRGVGIGALNLWRVEVSPFSDDEVALVEAFAAQAVIAIENVRQFRELQTRLESEQATGQVLEVISQSRSDDKPVFDAILRQASRLCDTPLAVALLGTAGDKHIRLASHLGGTPEFVAMFKEDPPLMDPEQSYAARAIVGGEIVHLQDMADSDLYKAGHRQIIVSVEQGGIRSFLVVPLLSGGRAIGAIALYRKSVQPFTDDQIALVETFAAQAVIAIENVRQFRTIQRTNAELETRLEHEAATREILQVISRSQDDEQPVFDVILEQARRLCGSPHAFLHLRDETDTHLVIAANSGARSDFIDNLRANPQPIEDRKSHVVRAVSENRVIQVEDLTRDEFNQEPTPQRRQAIEVEGVRTLLVVPLVAGDRAIGGIVLYRRQVAPFSENEINLVQGFAAQAVIAIQNVRQFRELQTRLERERASRDVLDVISQSRDEDQPVFDVILENAARLCHSPIATLVLVDDARENWVVTAHWGDPVDSTWIGRPVPLDGSLATSLAILEKRCIQIADVADDDAYLQGQPDRVRLVDEEGVRTLVCVPLVQGDLAVGCIVLYRREVRPFPDDEIALVETFAAQAVIAIENVRQFRELQSRLEREAASREILGVISRSRDDEKPVFDVILQNAARLCGAPQAGLVLGRKTDPVLTMGAHIGAREGMLELFDSGQMPMDSKILFTAKAIEECRIIHLSDLGESELYRSGSPQVRRMVDYDGIRTTLFVPLISGNEAIGAIVVYRREVKPFEEREISLMETFAAQAVIAIQNVRQFRELQTRLEREEATRDILSVISQSRDDDQRVFDVIVQHASRLCDARPVLLNMLNEARTHVRFVAKSDSMKSDYFVLGQEFDVREGRIRKQVIDQGEVLHVPDMAATQGYAKGDEWHLATVDREGIRTMLSVPLISGGRAIGFLMLSRREMRSFADDEIALIQTFAAQAVIAIENVRQFRELQTRLEREEATREILQVMSQSRDDEQPVFDVILDRALRLCDAPLGLILLGEPGDAYLTPVAHRGGSDDWIADFREHPLPRDEGSTLNSRAVRECRALQVADLRDTDLYRTANHHVRIAVDDEGMRTILSVPLIRNEHAIGTVCLYRREVKAFEDREIFLMETFAAQAVIAIENVRQFRELETRLEREAATREILQVISRSREDETPVFDMILKNAARLCRAPLASLNLLDDLGERLILRARWGDKLDEMEEGVTEFPLVGNSAPAMAVRESRLVHVEDLADTEAYRNGDPVRARAVDVHGIRSFLAVPLLRDGKAIGCIDLFRREVNPFEERHVELIETFAAQAVIAIENVRQLTALIEARDDAEAALADLRKAQERLIQAEKMASLGQLTAGIAHEIKNPLNFVNNFARLSGDMVTELAEILEGPIASLDEEDREDAEDLMQTVRDNLDKINQHGQRADNIVKNMLLHSREGPSQRGTARVNSIASEALNLAYHGARAENSSFNVEMTTDLAEGVDQIECYPQDLMRVFLNIISNGMYAAYKRSLDEAGFAPTITVSSRRDADRVVVEVRDNGMGIPADVREKIFTPFFTTKPAGEGTGLGLSLSYDIVVKQHGGDLTVQSEPGHFTVITVSLPQTLPAETGGI